jgi:hypothetical protein
MPTRYPVGDGTTDLYLLLYHIQKVLSLQVFFRLRTPHGPRFKCFPLLPTRSLVFILVYTCCGHHSLSDRLYSGTLPPEWSVWTQLQVFDVNSNAISGSLPSAYSSWTQLHFFLAYANMMDGVLPPEYDSWTSIMYFLVYGNSFTGMQLCYCPGRASTCLLFYMLPNMRGFECMFIVYCFR